MNEQKKHNKVSVYIKSVSSSIMVLKTDMYALDIENTIQKI